MRCRYIQAEIEQRLEDRDIEGQDGNERESNAGRCVHERRR
jgi:hypothetical protein